MAPTPIIHPLLENGLLYKLSLQPALNNLVNTYLSHEGPLSDLKFDYKDAQPWIQVFILITGLGVGTFLFLRALNAPEEVSRTSVGAARKRTENKVREGANGLAKESVPVLNTHGGVLNPSAWQTYTLVGKDHLSPNTALYKFKIPALSSLTAAIETVTEGAPRLGLPIGQHISVQAEIAGKKVMRSYTPTTLDDEDPGHFHLVVKSYEKGNISRYLSLLTIGQEVQVKGPKGKFIYTNDLSPHLLMLAGGTGITPMYQIIKASLRDPKDKTVLRLIYANVNEEDILLREDLDKLQAESGGRLDIQYVLNNPPANWTGGSGFITREMIESFMPHDGVGAPVGGSKVLLCGPPPMINAMKGHLGAIGYPAPNTISKLEDQVFCF